MQKLILTVNGMTCSHCESAVNTAIRRLPGIKSVKSSAKKNTSTIKFDETQTDSTAIKAAITEIGYEPTL